MSVVNSLIFLLLIITGTVAVFTRSPLIQSIILNLFGSILSLYLLILQAPEVALSEIVVSLVVIPLMILLALAKIKEYELLSRQKDAEK